MLNLDAPAEYLTSAHRAFLAGEKHVTRTCPYDVLVMVYDGILRFHENGEAIEVAAGEYYLQHRGLFQEGRLASSEPKYYFIHFTGDASSSAHMLPCRGTADFTLLGPLIHELEQAQLTGAPYIEKQQAFYRILSALRRPLSQTEGQRSVRKIISHVYENLHRPCPLGELSALCGYSPNYVIRLFRRETGLTPHAFITHLRLDRARQLLDSSEMSAEQVASACGFASYTSFYREFLRQEGVSPAEWRRRHLGC